MSPRLAHSRFACPSPLARNCHRGPVFVLERARPSGKAGTGFPPGTGAPDRHFRRTGKKGEVFNAHYQPAGPQGPRTAEGQIQGPCDGSEPAEARSEEHTSELQSLMRISYAVLCLKKKSK